jgi:hypothetical protein
MDIEMEGVAEMGMKVDDGVDADVPSEDLVVDVDAVVNDIDGGDEGRMKGDNKEHVLEDADGVREADDLCLAMLVHWAGLA